jgi:hypothetical protein
MHAWRKTLYLFMGIIVAFVTQEASAIYINNIIKEKLMSEENKPEAEELKIKFEEDGKEYVVNDMPDNAKELYIRYQKEKQNRDNIILNANETVDNLNRLLTSFEADMRNILESTEEKKIEVSK